MTRAWPALTPLRPPITRRYTGRRPARYGVQLDMAELLLIQAAGLPLPGQGTIEVLPRTQLHHDPTGSDTARDAQARSYRVGSRYRSTPQTYTNPRWWFRHLPWKEIFDHPHDRLVPVPGGDPFDDQDWLKELIQWLYQQGYPVIPTGPGLGPLEPLSQELLERLLEQLPGWGSGSQSTPPPRLAINLVSFHLQDAFDNTSAMVGDTVALDAAIVRQPGLVNLFLPHIYDISGPGAALSLPWIGASEFDVGVLQDRIASCSSWRYLREVLDALPDGGQQKVLITFIDLGGGSAPPWGQEYDPGDGTGRRLPLAPTNGDQQDPIFVPWHVELDGTTFPDDLSGSDASFDVGGADWRRFTLDPRNPVKRMYFRLLSQALGRALEALAHEYDRDKGVDISTLIEGIEIGNELEVRHTLAGDVDPEGWAQFYYACSTALRAECDWVPLFLPALASYAPGGAAKGLKAGAGTVPGCMTWEGKRYFLEQVLEYLAEYCSGTTALGTEFALEELVDGVDYHFYHNAAATSDDETPGDTAISLHYLASEVVELKDLLAGTLPRAVLSVCESGVNVLCSRAQVQDGFACETVPGEGTAHLIAWRPEGVTDPLQFQASSVIMRLSIALAAGAPVAGWHSHFAMPDSFQAMGLHVDQLNPKTAVTRDLRFRPAWWSFQRLAQVVKAATGVRMLHPEVRPRTGIDDSPFTSTEMVWIIEIEGATWPDDGGVTADSSGLWKAYLLFVEPGGPATPPPASATVRLQAGWTSSSGEPGPDADRARRLIYQLPTVPDSVEHSELVPVDQFPFPAWKIAETRSLSPLEDLGSRTSEWTFTLRPQDPPVLLFATRSLRVADGGVVVEE